MGFVVGVVAVHGSVLTATGPDTAVQGVTPAACGKRRAGPAAEAGAVKRQDDRVTEQSSVVEVVRHGLAKFKTRLLKGERSTED